MRYLGKDRSFPDVCSVGRVNCDCLRDAFNYLKILR